MHPNSSDTRFLAVLSNWLPLDAGSNSSIRQGLQRLLLLRTFITVASVLALFVFQFSSDLQIPYSFIGIIVIAILASIVIGTWRLKASPLMSNAELFGHLMVDVIFLFVLLLYTGGASNPLISYMLVLLALAATILPSAFVNMFAVISIAFYTFFILLDLQMDHSSGQEMMGQDTNFQLHLVGMWVIFVVSAILISVFITRMASAIKVREENLANARENEIRNEQLVAIGTLAAGTAHALGTPLSTMSVLLTELDNMKTGDMNNEELKEDISVLRQQVNRCKNSLSELTRYYNKSGVDDRESITILQFATDIKEYIINIHPAANVQFDVSNVIEQYVDDELSLKHALINIIENGIKAARNKVSVEFSIASEKQFLEITISDDGPGIPSQVIENIGEPFISMRKESMGIGIFLANAAVQKLKGTIELFNLKTGGARTLIRLPLENLLSLNAEHGTK